MIITRLQSNRKTEEGEDHPDRDAQFRHINLCVTRTLAAGMPVISVDTKKKELIGNYDNAGAGSILPYFVSVSAKTSANGGEKLKAEIEKAGI